MALEPIGLLTLLVGLSCLVFGKKLSIFSLLIASLLGASAAAFITAMNNANVQPAHFLMVFLAAGLFLRGPALKSGLESLAVPRAGFWLLLTLIYGIVAAILMPRIFAGTTYVFNIAQQGSGGAGIVQVPLGPVSSNVTQSIYFAADFICFIVFYAYSSDREGLQTIAKAMILCAFINLGFALLDLVTYLTGTAESLSFFRNTGYRMLDDVELGGFKRIVGSFTEASAFAYATLGLFAFTFMLWLRGAYLPFSAIAASLSLVALVFSTSTAGYVGLSSFMLILYAGSFLQLLARRATPGVLIFLVFAPIVASILAISIWLHPVAWNTVQQVREISLFSKLDSESGIERASWNAQAVNAFRDTMGWGAGIGSVRASSWLIAVPASIGVVGALTYGIFVVCVLLGGYLRKQDAEMGPIQSAARASCLAQIIASSVAGSFIDLGLVFFALAGAACAIPQTNIQPAGMRPGSFSMAAGKLG